MCVKAHPNKGIDFHAKSLRSSSCLPFLSCFPFPLPTTPSQPPRLTQLPFPALYNQASTVRPLSKEGGAASTEGKHQRASSSDPSSRDQPLASLSCNNGTCTRVGKGATLSRAACCLSLRLVQAPRGQVWGKGGLSLLPAVPLSSLTHSLFPPHNNTQQSSGFGVKGSVGRCYPIWSAFEKCLVSVCLPGLGSRGDGEGAVL
jgi:hypothetical protein